MNAIKSEESNVHLGHGNNPNTIDLDVTVAKHPDPVYEGTAMVWSEWELTEEERKLFLETGRLYIGIMVNAKRPSVPPILPTPYNPFKELGYIPLTPEELISK